MEAPFVVKEDPDQGISMEQRQTAQKFARESQDLAQKGRALLQALDATGKQLDDVAGRVAGMKNPDAALAAKVKAVKDKVEAIKAVFYVSPPDQGFYRKPLMVAFRGGTAAELVTGGSRGFGSMDAPTQTVIDQFNDFKAFAEPLFQKMKDITEKDVPELNKLLAEKGVPYIK
jgi:NAD(P)H-dependent FMN reductase